jgi:hypothetical protein
MADFIISPYAISFNSIKNALQNYIQNKSDVTKTWKDFYASGAGETIVELDAAVAAFYAFHFIIGRRESYLTVAQNYNSLVGGALALGYNASRGHNVFAKLKIVPTKSQTLPKWTVIGSYAEYDIMLLQDVILNKGVAIDVPCVFGNVSAQTLKIATANLQQFVFTASDVTDTCRLILTDKEVPFSTELKDAMNDRYIMLTNPFGAVDVFYLNQGNYKYTSADTLTLQYVQRNNLTFGTLSMSNIIIDIADQVEEMALIEDRLDVEDKEHIRISAPIYHETNNVVRARKDYVKFLKQNNPLIIDANDKDINPGLIALTYLKKQESGDGTTLLTEAEKQDYIKSIQEICPDGVAKAFIEDPTRIVRALQINLWQKANENIQATIEEDIDNILSAYRNKLEPVLDLEQIEHDIEKLPGVKIARVQLDTKEYTTNTKYKLYDVVTIPKVLVGNDYQTWTVYCAEIQSQTGDMEPEWAAAPQDGDQLQDNNFIWEKSNKYANSIVTQWQQNGAYELYSDINTSYLLPPHCTLATQPTWGRQAINDGNVTWNLLKDYTYKLPTRSVNTKYSLGDNVIIDLNDKRAVYTVSDVTHKCGKFEPNWDVAKNIGDIVIDNALTWTLVYKGWQPETNYLQGDQIGVSKDGKLYIYSATAGTTGKQNPFAKADPHVQDNNITWTLEEQKPYTEWVANTDFPMDIFVNGFDRYYQVTSRSNTTTSDQPLQFESWPDTFVDNNLQFTIDNYVIADKSYKCIADIWKGKTAFYVGDVIICSNASGTYVYTVNHSSLQEMSVSNAIYSVVNYAGTTGRTQPTWTYTKQVKGKPQTFSYDNVQDNDILWTKTQNVGEDVWEASTPKQQGDIIKTEGGYYIFSSVLGTSGATAPNWTGAKNNSIRDNNITWVRISDSNTMALQWNEYLDLTANSPTIIG